MKFLIVILFLVTKPVSEACCQDRAYVIPDTLTFKSNQKPDYLSSHILLFKNDKGKVYSLTIDRMPCLVPDSNGLKTMPVIRSEYLKEYRGIPNGFGREGAKRER